MAEMARYRPPSAVFPLPSLIWERAHFADRVLGGRPGMLGCPFHGGFCWPVAEGWRPVLVCPKPEGCDDQPDCDWGVTPKADAEAGAPNG